VNRTQFLEFKVKATLSTPSGNKTEFQLKIKCGRRSFLPVIHTCGSMTKQDKLIKSKSSFTGHMGGGRGLTFPVATWRVCEGRGRRWGINPNTYGL